MKLLLVATIGLLALLVSVSAVRTNGRIVGGNDARVGQFSFSVVIYTSTATTQFLCGGALISNEWILTAGQCVNNARQFTIQLGSNHLSDADSNRVIASTSHYELHPDFDPVTLVNDVGLIKLREPLFYNDYIERVLLAYGPLNAGSTLTAVGWGQTSDEVGRYSEQLQYVDLVSLSLEECRSVYGNQIDDAMLCVAGEYNEGTCIGDTGSPLLEYQSVSRSVRHVGIASFVSGNGCEGLDPSGYTKTYSFRDWIRNVTEI